jgi:hypothetical protein
MPCIKNAPQWHDFAQENTNLLNDFLPRYRQESNQQHDRSLIAANRFYEDASKWYAIASSRQSVNASQLDDNASQLDEKDAEMLQDVHSFLHREKCLRVPKALRLPNQTDITVPVSKK